jgi:hypothetical protein
MATGAELLDVPAEFEFEGKVYQVSRIITFQMEQELCDWVFRQALDRIERQRALARAVRGAGMTEPQYQKALDRLYDNQAAGKFDWEGELVIQALQEWPGNKYMTWLRFRRFDPKVEYAMIERIFTTEDSARALALAVDPTLAGGSEQKQKKESDAAPATENA